MIEKLFIEDRQWEEANDIMDTVTKAGPHMVMYQDKNPFKKVLGSVRIKSLNKLYDGSDIQYRLYMQQPFIENFFKNGDYCALGSKGIALNFLRFLEKRTSQKIMREIISESTSLKPEETFDLITSLTDSVSFMQFVPAKIQYIIPLINQSVRLSKAMGNNFITTTLEEDIVSDTIFSLQDTYNNIFNKTEKIVCVVARKDNFLNKHTKERHKTWVLFIDCFLAVMITDYIIKQNLNMKTIRYASKRRLLRRIKNGTEPIIQKRPGISSDVASATGFDY